MPTHKVTRTAVAFIALIFSGRAVLQDRKAAVAYAYGGRLRHDRLQAKPRLS